MSDNRFTVKLEPEQAQYLEKKDNKSAYIRDLIQADMQGHDVDTIGLQIQIETLEKQAQQAAEKEEMYQSRVEELRQLKSQVEQKEDVELQEAKEQLEDTPKDPTNPAVKKWASRVSLTPEELCEELDHT